MSDDRVLVIAPAALGRASWLTAAAARRGLRVGGPSEGTRRYYYGGPNFADRTPLGVALLEPPDPWLRHLPYEYTCRYVHHTKLGRVRRSGGPFFAKPPSSKDFPARVYADGADLASATGGLPPETPVLVSDVVRFAAEYRVFLLDGRAHTGSRYAVWGNLDPGPIDDDRITARAEDVAAGLPSAVVVDVGLLGPPDDPRECAAVVEANMAWFAQPYQSDPDRVLDVVLRAAGPLDEVSEADRKYLRQPR
ncbi:MAG: ATP-grasp domain-containing protein [Actinomycetota bacterium]|nr:ATP-grasp domain-containing protein [Actinomycetota bacterium]